MNIDAGVSIVVSFACFAWIFVKKVLPIVLSALDEYIDGIKNRLSSIDKEKEQALSVLSNSQVRQKEIFKVIDDERQRSQERIKQLNEDNDQEIVALRDQYQFALKTKLDSEMSKQKNAILNQLSDVIVDKLAEKFQQSDTGSIPVISKQDLSKLM